MNTKGSLAALLSLLAVLTVNSSQLLGQSESMVRFETTVPSGGSEAGTQLPSDDTAFGPYTSPRRSVQHPMAPDTVMATVGVRIPGPGFDDNAAETAGPAG